MSLCHMAKYHRKHQSRTTDEFVSFWQRTFELVLPYARPLGITVLTAIVVAGVIWGIVEFTDRRSERAAEEFAFAVKIVESPLIAPGETALAPKGEKPVPRFLSDKERQEAALATLDQLRKRYSSSSVAGSALLFRATALFRLARYNDAISAYRDFLASRPKDNLFAAMAHEGLGYCHEAQAKLDDALKEFQEAGRVAEKSNNLYRDRAALAEARIWAKKGDKKKAIERIRDALGKSPTTPLKPQFEAQIVELEAT